MPVSTARGSSERIAPRAGWDTGGPTNTSPLGPPANDERHSSRLPVIAAFCGLTSICLAAVIAGLPPAWAAAAWAGTVLAAGCAVSSEVGITTLVLVFVLLQRDQVFAASLPLLGGGLKPTDLLLFATMGGWVVRRLAGRQRSIPLSGPVLVLSLAYVGWAVSSAVVGISRGAFYKDSLLELRPLLQYTLVLPLLTEVSVPGVLRICRLFLLAAVVVAAKAVYLYVTGQGSQALYSGGNIRIMSVSFSALLIASILGLSLYAGADRRRPMYLLASLAALLGLGVTLQRTAFLALPFGVLTMALVLGGVHRRRLAGGLMAAGLLAAAAAASTSIASQGKASLLSAVVQRTASIGDFSEDVSAQHRLREWSAALDIVRRHPLTGGGLGTRVGFYSPMYGEVSHRMGYWSSDIYMHNSYMWMLTKMGIVGLGCFLALLMATAREVFLHGRRSSALRRILLSGLLATLVLFVICSFFGPIFNVDESSSTVAFTIGSLCIVLRSEPLTGRAAQS
jgi:O-antigen ligase